MATQNTEHVSYATPDEVREFPHGRVEIVKVGGAEIGRLILQPGWRWSRNRVAVSTGASANVRQRVLRR